MRRDVRQWAKAAAGLDGIPDAHLDHDQRQQIDRLAEHADDEPRTSYRDAGDLFTRPTNWSPFR